MGNVPGAVVCVHCGDGLTSPPEPASSTPPERSGDDAPGSAPSATSRGSTPDPGIPSSREAYRSSSASPQPDTMQAAIDALAAEVHGSLPSATSQHSDEQMALDAPSAEAHGAPPAGPQYDDGDTDSDTLTAEGYGAPPAGPQYDDGDTDFDTLTAEGYESLPAGPQHLDGGGFLDVLAAEVHGSPVASPPYDDDEEAFDEPAPPARAEPPAVPAAPVAAEQGGAYAPRRNRVSDWRHQPDMDDVGLDGNGHSGYPLAPPAAPEYPRRRSGRALPVLLVAVLTVGALVTGAVLLLTGRRDGDGGDQPEATGEAAGPAAGAPGACAEQPAAPGCVQPVLGTGNVQVVLRWETGDDLDLRVTDPNGEDVYYNLVASSSGGRLDGDANADCEETASAPAEQVTWPAGEAPTGTYQVHVESFEACGHYRATDYTLTVTVGGQVVLEAPGSVAEGESDPYSFAA